MVIVSRHGAQLAFVTPDLHNRPAQTGFLTGGYERSRFKRGASSHVPVAVLALALTDVTVDRPTRPSGLSVAPCKTLPFFLLNLSQLFSFFLQFS